VWFRVWVWHYPNPNPKYWVSPEPGPKPSQLGFYPLTRVRFRAGFFDFWFSVWSSLIFFPFFFLGFRFTINFFFLHRFVIRFRFLNQRARPLNGTIRLIFSYSIESHPSSFGILRIVFFFFLKITILKLFSLCLSFILFIFALRTIFFFQISVSFCKRCTYS
jgi:hypothetical protein